MQAKLLALRIGYTQEQVDQIMGGQGAPDQEVGRGEFIPRGWFGKRWSDPDGTAISALFDERGVLVHIEPHKVPGGIEWMKKNPNYAITDWLNQNIEKVRLPVRLPAVEVTATAPNSFQFRGGLVNNQGRFVGTITGTYYVGDGTTTYVPGDTMPYTRAIEGSYQFTREDGMPIGDTFGLLER